MKTFTALMASNDEHFQSKMKTKNTLFKNLFITDSKNLSHTYLNSNIKIDILVIDLDGFECVDFFAISSMRPHQQFVFLAKNRKSYLTLLRNFKGGSSTILFKPVRFSALLDNIELLVSKTNSQLLNLNETIKIDIIKEQIFSNEKQIFLTSMMHKLLLVLASNSGSLTTFEMIDESVYDGRCNSRIAMQNLVGNLRRVLNLDIKSVNSKGYVLYTNSSECSNLG